MTRAVRVIPACLALCAGLILVVSVAGAADPAAAANKAPPPLPTPEFTDAAVNAEYQAAVKLLEDGSFKMAKKAFKRIKTETAEQKDAIDRCLREVAGHIDLEKIEKDAAKGKSRKALKSLKKVIAKYEGTLVAAAMQEKQSEIFGELFHMVADFEPEGASRSEGASSRPKGDNRARGTTGYGNNTKFVKDEALVREGTQALGWKTGREFGYISFDEVQEICAEYRYLRMSIRCEDPKLRPKLHLIFDTSEDRIRGGGGRRGGGRIYGREGFHHGLVPEAKWQDLRLDLHKDFNPKGDVAWDEVLALRILHMPGTEGTIYIDDIRLEKE